MVGNERDIGNQQTTAEASETQRHLKRMTCLSEVRPRLTPDTVSSTQMDDTMAVVLIRKLGQEPEANEI